MKRRGRQKKPRPIAKSVRERSVLWQTQQAIAQIYAVVSGIGREEDSNVEKKHVD